MGAAATDDEHSTLVFEILEEQDQEPNSSIFKMLLPTSTKRFKKKIVYHSQLREEYRDVLPESMRLTATQRQIDAFQLFLLACDMTYI